MKLNLALPFLIFVLAGCSMMDGIKPIQGADGLYRTNHMPESVLRNSNEEVITSEAEAKKVLASTKSLIELIHNSRAERCSLKQVYRAKVAQLRAEQLLNAKDWKAAIASLDEAQRECGEMHFISAQNYYLAVAQQGLGEIEQAKASARRFLNYASAYRPASFVQGPSKNFSEDAREFADEEREFGVLREMARSFVDGTSQLPLRLRPAETPKFYHNGFFRPGSNRREGAVLLPAIGFGGARGSVFGLLGYRSWGEYGVGASYLSSSRTGGYFGAKLRKSLYESENRDTDLEGFIAGRTKKKYSYRLSSYGEYDDVKVLDSSFDPGVGFGATKRFLPELGVSGQLIAYADGIDGGADYSSSLYGFYDLNSVFTFNTGWIYNAPVASISILFAHVGYNFREKELTVFIQGIDF